ncbi:MAG: hypothetical protein Athens101428_356 [Candidatus Berkelbacteria bacterium Athens1014_28]|uniref:F5/8 type C domain-containing protein n=1 Tax=Candidatus Berkelbacteria bacterium Athens1014_28 TaxID=2017145 RepID=A0A554LN61_9BACT|nr:MAG: hypothetical protein Athens101428_356 [Candidatus Berkelbacteria bacterium Athens1014_28]
MINKFNKLNNSFKILIISLFFIVMAIVVQLIMYNNNNNQLNTKAASSTTKIDLEAEWELGVRTNIDSTSVPGDIKIQDYSSTQIGYLAIYQNEPSMVSVTANDSEKSKAIDVDEYTYWYDTISGFGDSGYWQIDLGENKTITKINALVDYSLLASPVSVSLTFLTSTNGVERCCFSARWFQGLERTYWFSICKIY